MSSDGLPVVRCWSCNLNQFARNKCARCRQPLEKPAEKPVAPLVEDQRRGSWRQIEYHETMAERVGGRLRDARVAKGLSQRQLGVILNVPRTYVSKFERGALLPMLGRLARISGILGVVIPDLIASDRELETKSIFADPFMRELVEAGNGMPAFYWKKAADVAARMSNG